MWWIENLKKFKLWEVMFSKPGVAHFKVVILFNGKSLRINKAPVKMALFIRAWDMLKSIVTLFSSQVLIERQIVAFKWGNKYLCTSRICKVTSRQMLPFPILTPSFYEIWKTIWNFTTPYIPVARALIWVWGILLVSPS